VALTQEQYTFQLVDESERLSNGNLFFAMYMYDVPLSSKRIDSLFPCFVALFSHFLVNVDKNISAFPSSQRSGMNADNVVKETDCDKS